MSLQKSYAVRVGRPIALAAVLALVASIPVVAPTAASERPVALKGSIAEAEGLDVDLSGAYVLVWAGPNDEVSAAAQIDEELPAWMAPADAVTTSGAGFTVHLEPAEVPEEFVNDDGRVHLEVDVIDADGSWMASTAATVRLVRAPDGTPHWIDPLDAPDWTSDVWTPAPTNVSDVPPYDPPEAVIEALASHTPDDAIRGMNGCGTITTKIREWATWTTIIGSGYPKGSAQSWMRYQEGHSTTLGMAVKASAWAASGSRTISNGWGFTWSESTAKRRFRVDVRYARKVKAYSQCGVIKNWWEPQYTTGGTSSGSILTPPDWSRCANAAVGVWDRSVAGHDTFRGSTAVKSAAKIGIDLSINVDYSRSRTLFYRVIGLKKLCGDSDYPSRAGKIRMRFR